MAYHKTSTAGKLKTIQDNKSPVPLPPSPGMLENNQSLMAIYSAVVRSRALDSWNNSELQLALSLATNFWVIDRAMEELNPDGNDDVKVTVTLKNGVETTSTSLKTLMDAQRNAAALMRTLRLTQNKDSASIQRESTTSTVQTSTEPPALSPATLKLLQGATKQ